MTKGTNGAKVERPAPVPFVAAGAGTIRFHSPTEKTMTHHSPCLPARAAAALLALSSSLFLPACGLGDSGSAAVTAAKLKAREAESAKAAKEQFEQQLAESQQKAAQRQKEIEAATR